MLRYFLFDTFTFASGEDKVRAEKDVVWFMHALTRRDQDYLFQHPHTPHLYKSGVKWEAPKQFQGDPSEVAIIRKALGPAVRNRDVQRVLDTMREVFGGEHFCDIGRILELGAIDCDGLACWRSAELRQKRIKADPYMISHPRLTGGTTYHALVLWPPSSRGEPRTSEDPSLLLGMGGERRAADRAEEIRKNQERCDMIRAARGGFMLPDVNALAAPDDMLDEILGRNRR